MSLGYVVHRGKPGRYSGSIRGARDRDASRRGTFWRDRKMRRTLRCGWTGHLPLADMKKPSRRLGFQSNLPWTRCVAGFWGKWDEGEMLPVSKSKWSPEFMSALQNRFAQAQKDVNDLAEHGVGGVYVKTPPSSSGAVWPGIHARRWDIAELFDVISPARADCGAKKSSPEPLPSDHPHPAAWPAAICRVQASTSSPR